MSNWSYAQGQCATRPWAYWRFDIGEEVPRGSDAEAVRLAELGLLRENEITALAERANEARMRIDTDAEHYGGVGGRERPDRSAVAETGRTCALPRPHTARTGNRDPSLLYLPRLHRDRHRCLSVRLRLPLVAVSAVRNGEAQSGERGSPGRRPRGPDKGRGLHERGPPPARPRLDGRGDLQRGSCR